MAGAAVTALGQTAPATKLNPHPDTAFARELRRLSQIDMLKLQAQEAKGTPAENLWQAELILAQFDALTKDKTQEAAVTADYLRAISAVLGSDDEIDGAWALDHAKFILSRLAQPAVTRMEYWGSREPDRAALAPLAKLAGELLTRGGKSLAEKLSELGAATPFDEKAYGAQYGVAADVRYYQAWADYFQAMAMAPGEKGRAALLNSAADAINEWAQSDTDNGVNLQAFLLRGKVREELGHYDAAIADFAHAQGDKAPEGIAFQARYQTVVAELKSGGDAAKAGAAFEALKRSIPKDNAEAARTLDMLGFRVSWALAQGRPPGMDRNAAEHAAIEALRQATLLDPRFRTLAYQELAATIPANAAFDTLLPMQQLALAYDQSQGQTGQTPESKAKLGRALEAAQAAAQNPTAGAGDKAEALFLEGACAALLGNLLEAAKDNVAFAEMAPQDPRARQMIELALGQIGELRKASAATGPATATAEATATAATDAGRAAEITALANRALKLATETFGDKQWLFAQGRLLEESGKTADAQAVYQKIAEDDPNYLDARYRLVGLARQRFGALEAKGSEAEQKQAAADVFAACTAFVALLDHPPAAAPKEVLEAAKGYRFNIWLIETETALVPGVRQPEVALDRLAKLDQAKGELSPAQRETVLRYRIEAWQMAGQPEKAKQAVQDYVSASGADAIHALEGMALTAADQIDSAKDPEQIRRLAAYVVQLLEPIASQADTQGQADKAFEYRLIQADMMVKAGQYAEAVKLSDSLQDQKKEDIRGFMTEARAYFFEAQAKHDVAEYAKAQDYFTRILARLAPGGEGFWEAWLRIIECMEAQNGDAATGQIKTRLADLKGVYGSKFGGERFKEDFAKLAEKYGAE